MENFSFFQTDFLMVSNFVNGTFDVKDIYHKYIL